MVARSEFGIKRRRNLKSVSGVESDFVNSKIKVRGRQVPDLITITLEVLFGRNFRRGFQTWRILAEVPAGESARAGRRAAGGAGPPGRRECTGGRYTEMCVSTDNCLALRVRVCRVKIRI